MSETKYVPVIHRLSGCRKMPNGEMENDSHFTKLQVQGKGGLYHRVADEEYWGCSRRL